MKQDCKRKYERFEISASVRFSVGADHEYDGEIINVSEGGLAIHSDAPVQPGDRIIAYPDGLGRVTGVVARKLNGGFAVELDISKALRSHLRKRIKARVSGSPFLRILDKRRHKRSDINLRIEARMRDSDNWFECRIVDVSDSGIRILSAERPPIGTEIVLGAYSGDVIRHTDDGFALVLKNIVALRQCA